MPALVASARTPTIANGLALDDYFDRVFRAERLPKANRIQLGVYRDAFAWLAKLLGRPPLVVDLTSDNLWRLSRFITSQHYGRHYRRRIHSTLTAVAHHAWRRGLLPHWNPERRVCRQRNVDPFRIAPPPDDALESLVQRYADDFGIVPSRKPTYLAAVGHFDRALGRYGTLADVTADNLDLAFAAESAGGLSRHTLLTYRNCVAYVLQAARGQRRSASASRFADPASAPVGTLRHFYYHRYEPERTVGLTAAHAETHRITQKLFAEFAGRDVPLAELTNKLVADFVRALLETPTCYGTSRKRSTCNNHRGRLLSVWRMAHEDGLTPEPPRVRKLKEDRDPPDAWTEDECRRILDAPPHVPFRSWRGEIPAPDLIRGVLFVVYYTALRRRTVFSLDLDALDLSTGWLSVPAKYMKNRVGKRFKLGRDAVAALAAIAHYPRTKLFPWPFRSFSPFDNYFKRLLQFAGIPPSTRSGPSLLHKLRRSTATITAARKGLAAASALLGHSSEAVTQRYVDPTQLPGADATEFLPMLVPLDRPTVSQQAADAAPAVAWLDDAAALFRAGWLIQAGFTCRIAIERALHALAFSVGHRGDVLGSVSKMAAELRRSGHIDADAHRLFKRTIEKAHKAAHGAPTSPERMAAVLDGAREFVLSILPSDFAGDEAGVLCSARVEAESPAIATA